MFLNDESTWPPEILRFLEDNEALLDDWYGPTNEYRTAHCDRYDPSAANRFSAKEHDLMLGAFDALLRTHTLEGGHHCTRLTDREIEAILRDGMTLQNRRTLETRILALQGEGIMDGPTAKALIEQNSADESSRAGLLWFCFYPPKFAGESGIKIFLRYWGGEALSRMHCDHPVRSSLLGSIGTPCVVIADVPIALLNSTHGLAIRLARQYFVNRGHEISEEIILEAYTKRPIPASAIRHILRYPDPSFLEVTGCHEWSAPFGLPASESR